MNGIKFLGIGCLFDKRDMHDFTARLKQHWEFPTASPDLFIAAAGSPSPLNGPYYFTAYSNLPRYLCFVELLSKNSLLEKHEKYIKHQEKNRTEQKQFI